VPIEVTGTPLMAPGIEAHVPVSVDEGISSAVAPLVNRYMTSPDVKAGALQLLDNNRMTASHDISTGTA
jgi:hypothetical protein